MKTKFIYQMLLVSGLLAISACSEKQEYVLLHEDDGSCDFVVSRSGDDIIYPSAETLTYRLLTYNINTFSFDVAETGTYSGVPGEVLIPTKLNDDGTIDTTASPEENKAMMLQGINAVRYVTCISPGLKHSADGSVDFCPADPRDGMLLSSTERFTVGSLKVFQLPPMKDMRSRLSFNVSIDPAAKDAIKNIEVRDFIVTGVGAKDEKVGILPKQRQINTPKRPREVTLRNRDEAFEVWETDPPVYVASAIYAPRDVTISTLKISEANATNIRKSDYLQASFFLSQNGGNFVKMTITLNAHIPELLPMYEYVFNFNVKSLVIDLYLEVYSYDSVNPHDWCRTDVDSQEIGDVFPSLSFYVGSWPIDNWNETDLNDNPEIGNTY